MSGVCTVRGINSGWPSNPTMSSLVRRKNIGLSCFFMDSSIIGPAAKKPGSNRSNNSLKLAGSPLCGVAVRNSRCGLIVERTSPRRYRMVLVVVLPVE